MTRWAVCMSESTESPFKGMTAADWPDFWLFIKNFLVESGAEVRGNKEDLCRFIEYTRRFLQRYHVRPVDVDEQVDLVLAVICQSILSSSSKQPIRPGESYPDSKHSKHIGFVARTCLNVASNYNRLHRIRHTNGSPDVDTIDDEGQFFSTVETFISFSQVLNKMSHLNKSILLLLIAGGDANLVSKQFSISLSQSYVWIAEAKDEFGRLWATRNDIVRKAGTR